MVFTFKGANTFFEIFDISLIDHSSANIQCSGNVSFILTVFKMRHNQCTNPL
jgi:hypothetical protein